MKCHLDWSDDLRMLISFWATGKYRNADIDKLAKDECAILRLLLSEINRQIALIRELKAEIYDLRRK